MDKEITMHDRIMIFRYNGKVFGYPDCCVEEFVKFFAYYPQITRTKEQEQIGQLSYGFIPCAHHAQAIIKGKIKIESLISDRDPFIKPFPYE